jgi:type IV secretion system protein VirB9
MKPFQCALVALAAVATIQAHAVNITREPDLSVPMPGNLDSRIRTFAYTPDVVFTLPVTVGMHTHIQLGADERLKELPRLGETVQWRVTGNARNLYIKALRPDTKTSLTLVTDKRVYQFELHSTTKSSERVQKATFTYPDDDDMTALASAIEQADAAETALREYRAQELAKQHAKQQELAPKPFDAQGLTFYKIDAKAPYNQMHVYDNGVMTWMRMPKGVQDAPAVFEIGRDDKLMPVNYTWADRASARDPDVILVDRVASKWMLKLGKDVEIKVTRD